MFFFWISDLSWSISSLRSRIDLIFFLSFSSSNFFVTYLSFSNALRKSLWDFPLSTRSNIAWFLPETFQEVSKILTILGSISMIRFFFSRIWSSLLLIISSIKSLNSSWFNVFALQITNKNKHTYVSKPCFVWRIGYIIGWQVILSVSLVYNEINNILTPQSFNMGNLADLDFVRVEDLYLHAWIGEHNDKSTFFLPRHISDKKTIPHSRWLIR